MTWKEYLKRVLPLPVQRLCWHALHGIGRNSKCGGELNYWQHTWEAGKSSFDASSCERRYLAVAGESTREFVAGKVVADFGCGPMGSLCWAVPAKVRIGIDVLADAYARFGIATHPMCYVWATESRIPLPSGYVDVLFVVNSLDHCFGPKVACRELLRILAPGGTLIGSFNIDHQRTLTEPSSLTEAWVRGNLLSHMDVTSYRVVPIGHAFDGTPAPTCGPRLLWARARKPLL